MFTGNTPDITPAQIVAVIGTVIGLLVDAQLVSGKTQHLIVGLASALVPFGIVIADAIIRHGRSRAMTPTASATIQVAPTQPQPPVA